jgi:hypothetical protein
MNQKGFAPFIILLIIAGFLIVGGFWYYESHQLESYQPSGAEIPNLPSQPITSNIPTSQSSTPPRVQASTTQGSSVGSSPASSTSGYIYPSEMPLQTLIGIDVRTQTLSANGCGPACQSTVNTTFQVHPETTIHSDFNNENLSFNELKVGDSIVVTVLTDRLGQYLMDNEAIVAKDISVQTQPIHITGISPSSASPNSSITISGSGFSSLANLPQGGDGYGDGIWLYNGKSSAELLGPDTKITGDNTIVTVVPTMMCGGQETNACSSSAAAPITPGIYSIYVKADNGTVRSGYGTIIVIPSSQ